MEPTKCPKCNGAFEEGFLADNTFPARILPGIWVAGPPDESFWSGKGSAQVAGKVKRRVQAYRCVACGYLECYASAEWPDS